MSSPSSIHEAEAGKATRLAVSPPKPDVPHAGSASTDGAALADSYRTVRRCTEALCEPLAAEDYVIQSMPDASPVKWHLAHTAWFFETFLLAPHLPGYTSFHPQFRFLFNSYYQGVGPRWPRPQRGLLSRPTAVEVFGYRAYVDRHVTRLLREVGTEAPAQIATTVLLGLHHEQQHQELILTDLKHAWAANPLHPVYREALSEDGIAPRHAWVTFPAGLAWIGHDGSGFAFDNESPRHKTWLNGFQLASRLVTNAEYLAFVNDGGYDRPELWLSDGWAARQAQGWQAPLYWAEEDGEWSMTTLAGPRRHRPDEPVCHVSYYEADAFARWAGARLPTEAEWETAASGVPLAGHFLEGGHFHPAASSALDDPGPLFQLYGDLWQWTASPYVGYPGYRPPTGALGEYNGKFMCNQFVLRGASCATPRSHARRTYRNFFPPDARWQFSGIRLAKELGMIDTTLQVPSADVFHHSARQFRADVLRGLFAPQKELPCKYFYDEVGSALFEQITELEEYYSTRTELAIMERHVAEMAGMLGPRCLLIEYGSGSSVKTRRLLDQLRNLAGYVPIDVSGEHLRRSARALGEEYPDIEVLPLCADFTQPLTLPACRKAAARRVVYFPGSTLGNFTPEATLALLRQTAGLCGRGGGFLLGIDMRKDPRVIEAAYNDRRGVTAAFNRNILVRINRELGADFDIEQFAHRAFYNAARGRIEMHLVSRRDQIVRVGSVPFFFAAGDSIHTENSYKYSLAALDDLAEAGGFAVESVWTDERQYFSVAYLTPRHSGNDTVLPERAGGRALLPAQTARVAGPVTRLLEEGSCQS